MHGHCQSREAQVIPGQWPATYPLQIYDGQEYQSPDLDWRDECNGNARKLHGRQVAVLPPCWALSELGHASNQTVNAAIAMGLARVAWAGSRRSRKMAMVIPELESRDGVVRVLGA